MAIERLPAVGVQPSPPQVRNTQSPQKAFFQAALGAVQAPEEPAPAAAPPPVQPSAKTEDTDGLPRGYRPGSLLDIRI